MFDFVYLTNHFAKDSFYEVIHIITWVIRCITFVKAQIYKNT